MCSLGRGYAVTSHHQYSVIVSIGKTRLCLKKTSHYIVAQRMLTLIANQQSTAARLLADIDAQEAANGVFATVSISGENGLALWEKREAFLTALMEEHLGLHEYERVIEGELA